MSDELTARAAREWRAERDSKPQRPMTKAQIGITNYLSGRWREPYSGPPDLDAITARQEFDEFIARGYTWVREPPKSFSDEESAAMTPPKEYSSWSLAKRNEWWAGAYKVWASK